MSGEKEPFMPLEPGVVTMYVCGVTVYDQCHIGHARALLTFDVIYRYLRFLGYDCRFVRNFTDVDDKIINRANEEGIAPEALAQRYIDEFHRDAAALGLAQPAVEPRATGHIPEMIAIVSRLVERGHAYEVAGDVYFAVESFGEYGKLSGRGLEEMMAGARIEVDDRKRHPMDFALWKSSKEGEPFWDSPWGRGRPGWHIECSAMSTKYLGQPFDIHGGGQDLVFPHNENEIAQSECAAEPPFARYWIHNGFVQLARAKMSKSTGNILSIREVLERFDPVALRLYMLTTHYRNPIEFSEEALSEAQRGVARIYETVSRVDRVQAPSPDGAVEPGPMDDFRGRWTTTSTPHGPWPWCSRSCGRSTGCSTGRDRRARRQTQRAARHDRGAGPPAGPAGAFPGGPAQGGPLAARPVRGRGEAAHRGAEPGPERQGLAPGGRYPGDVEGEGHRFEGRSLRHHLGAGGMTREGPDPASRAG